MEPMAISESMLGERFHSVLKPTWKYLRFTYTIGSSRRSWVNANGIPFSAPWNAFLIISGTGRPIHSFSMWCIARYISGIQNAKDTISRVRMDFSSSCTGSTVFCAAAAAP